MSVRSIVSRVEGGPLKSPCCTLRGRPSRLRLTMTMRVTPFRRRTRLAASPTRSKTTADAMNEEWVEAEKAMVSLNLGIEGRVTISEGSGWERFLAFRKTKRG